ncbi:MAG: hypothetical protein DMF61_09800 [Blastocatellia bacterium AA13]|nr:MAG: hypothetical protein DMF61_09800 [Blastocatellia bacterium AA13]
MDHRVDRAIEFIEMNYANNIGLRDLTKCVRLSTSRLAVLFQSEIGRSPLRYLKEIRIQKAAQLLSSDYLLSIKEVMGKVGLMSPSHFTHSFKDAFGVTPTEYRANSLSRLPSRSTLKIQARESLQESLTIDNRVQQYGIVDARLEQK